MTKEEFLKKLQEYGINLDRYQIAIDYKTREMYYTGIYKDGNKWIVYNVGDRNEVSIFYEGNERTAYMYIYGALLTDIENAGFVNQSITEDVIQTSKSYVCDFLQKKYSISKSDAENTWEHLLHDFRILNEVKYFTLNNDFVSEKHCVKIRGYSARDIYEKTYLTEIGAYNYLIYLEENPEQALENLRKGLPRKCKSND